MISGERGTKMGGNISELTEEYFADRRVFSKEKTRIQQSNPDHLQPYFEIFHNNYEEGVNQGIDSMQSSFGGIEIPDLRKAQSEWGDRGKVYSVRELNDRDIIAEVVVEEGSKEPGDFLFLHRLNDVVHKFEKFYSIAKNDPVIKQRSDKIVLNTKSLGELSEGLEESIRVRKALDEVWSSNDEENRVNDKTLDAKMEFALSMQGLVFDIFRKDSRNIGTLEERKSDMTLFAIKFFDNLSRDYNMETSHKAFMRAQERGVISTILAMMDLEDKGFEITPSTIKEDKHQKIDFKAAKWGKTFNVQSKSGKQEFSNLIIIDELNYVDFKDELHPDIESSNDIHKQGFKIAQSGIVSIDDTFSPGKIQRLYDKNKGMIWTQQDPYRSLDTNSKLLLGRAI